MSDFGAPTFGMTKLRGKCLRFPTANNMEYQFNKKASRANVEYWRCQQCMKKDPMGKLPVIRIKNGRIIDNPEFPKYPHYCEPIPVAKADSIQNVRGTRLAIGANRWKTLCRKAKREASASSAGSRLDDLPTTSASVSNLVGMLDQSSSMFPSPGTGNGGTTSTVPKVKMEPDLDIGNLSSDILSNLVGQQGSTVDFDTSQQQQAGGSATGIFADKQLLDDVNCLATLEHQLNQHQKQQQELDAEAQASDYVNALLGGTDTSAGMLQQFDEQNDPFTSPQEQQQLTSPPQTSPLESPSPMQSRSPKTATSATMAATLSRSILNVSNTRRGGGIQLQQVTSINNNNRIGNYSKQQQPRRQQSLLLGGAQKQQVAPPQQQNQNANLQRKQQNNYIPPVDNGISTKPPYTKGGGSNGNNNNEGCKTCNGIPPLTIDSVDRLLAKWFGVFMAKFDSHDKTLSALIGMLQIGSTATPSFPSGGDNNNNFGDADGDTTSGNVNSAGTNTTTPNNVEDDDYMSASGEARLDNACELMFTESGDIIDPSSSEAVPLQEDASSVEMAPLSETWTNVAQAADKAISTETANTISAKNDIGSGIKIVEEETTDDEPAAGQSQKGTLGTSLRCLTPSASRRTPVGSGRIDQVVTNLTKDVGKPPTAKKRKATSDDDEPNPTTTTTTTTEEDPDAAALSAIATAIDEAFAESLMESTTRPLDPDEEEDDDIATSASAPDITTTPQTATTSGLECSTAEATRKPTGLTRTTSLSTTTAPLTSPSSAASSLLSSTSTDPSRFLSEKVKCQICAAMLPNKAYAMSHIQSHFTPLEGEGGLLCGRCGDLLDSVESLTKHLKDEHQIC